jgi:mannose-6-phosphate isomerase-like protein (cupin superfamily)
MTNMPIGVTAKEEAYNGVVWHILGQTYTLKQHSDDSMAWHALFPDGTFVPPHLHTNQDEFLYVLTGRFDIWLDGKDMVARPGDLVRLPKGVPHAFFNKSGAPATSLFWATPTQELKTLFDRIADQADPREVVRMAKEHAIEFLPPPS